METRRELKQEVKDLFHGHWRTAILMAIIPALLIFLGILDQTRSQTNAMSSYQDSLNSATADASNYSIAAILIGFVIVLLVFFIVLLLMTLIYNMFVVSSQYSFLEWLRNPERENHVVRDATSAFSREYGWHIVGLTALTSIYVFLWCLLFIVPGVIKGYAYSQTFFVYKDMLAETPAGQPRPTYRAAITRSRQLMRGHKMQYFVLQLSFIGWNLLSGILLGIGSFWLTPYQFATNVNYYIHLVAHDRSASGVNSMVA